MLTPMADPSGKFRSQQRRQLQPNEIWRGPGRLNYIRTAQKRIPWTIQHQRQTRPCASWRSCGGPPSAGGDRSALWLPVRRAVGRPHIASGRFGKRFDVKRGPRTQNRTCSPGSPPKPGPSHSKVGWLEGGWRSAEN